jgi:hypothetical protein
MLIFTEGPNAGSQQYGSHSFPSICLNNLPIDLDFKGLTAIDTWQAY